MPPNATVVKMELWKIAQRVYEKKVEACNRNSDQAYAITLGQCLQALWNQMEAHTIWHNINNTLDAIGLLRLIQTCMTQGKT
jgi:hypothetical protein